ncbi:unnamed protein product, partial [Meganyctiphanes norvegica]
LSQPLTKRRGDGTIGVNFSTSLLEGLQELKYTWVIGDQVDTKDSQLTSCQSTFGQYITNLQTMVDGYNYIFFHTTAIEQKLIEEEMNEINKHIQHGEDNLTWKSDGIWSYIETLSNLVNDLEQRVRRVQKNLCDMDDLLLTWVQQPIYERKEGKKDTLLNLEDRNERLKKVYSTINSDGEKIKCMVNENKTLLRINEVTQDWLAYLEYLDSLIINGLVD